MISHATFIVEFAQIENCTMVVSQSRESQISLADSDASPPEKDRRFMS
jgi:hypothetical protein